MWFAERAFRGRLRLARRQFKFFFFGTQKYKVRVRFFTVLWVRADRKLLHNLTFLDRTEIRSSRRFSVPIFAPFNRVLLQFIP